MPGGDSWKMCLLFAAPQGGAGGDTWPEGHR